MSTETETAIEQPVAKQTRRRKARNPRRAAAPQANSEMAGLTETNCASACNAERCVISGRGYCAHPRKNGLQSVDMHNVAAMERLQRAQKLLGKKALDKRFT